VNKSKVAWKYLPKRYFYSTAFMWSLEYLKKSGWDFGGWLRGWRSVVRVPREEKRRAIGDEALEYLKKVEARLWY